MYLICLIGYLSVLRNDIALCVVPQKDSRQPESESFYYVHLQWLSHCRFYAVDNLQRPTNLCPTSRPYARSPLTVNVQKHTHALQRVLFSYVASRYD
ncbi:hypothetical protein GY45DRAFT_460539 [Cubamyces sp. BRFM 1775]|nr:hypothetical protein GY45DRAFT_460539 [Cubamyces sp. BRFM 1775]